MRPSIVEHEPDPLDAENRPSVLKTVAGYIIVNEFCERLAYYGFAGSLVLFFQNELNMSNADADVAYSTWAGACYVTPLLGGYIADKYLGRYYSILIFASIYLVGLVLVVLSTIPGEINSTMIFTGMYIIALGTGGIKPNVSTMGADQFDDRYSQDRLEKESFFNWFYWSINLGALISYTLVSYICQYGIPWLGGEDWGFFVGYMIPLIFMALAIVVFLLGTSKYIISPPQGSVLARALNIVREAFCMRYGVPIAPKEPLQPTQAGKDVGRESLSKRVYPNQTSPSVGGVMPNSKGGFLILKRSNSLQGEGMKGSRSSPTASFSRDARESLLGDDKDGYKNSNRSISSEGLSTSVGGAVAENSANDPPKRLHALDRACKEYGGHYSFAEVEGVKLVFRLFPFLLVMIMYWGVYSQMSTAFQNQGCQMSLYMGNVPVPVSALNMFDTIAILLLIPVFEGHVYPYFKKRGTPLTMLDKIGYGLLFALLSMVVGGLVEIYRLQNKPTAGDYYDEAARDNISPCQNIDDYNPYEYQKWYAGEDVDEPAYCSLIDGCSYLDDVGQNLLSLDCISCDLIPQMSTVSVFWQVPQFALIGISEILASITSLEFFYSQAPLPMRSVTQSLNLFMTALGSWITIPLLIMVNIDPNNEWVPTNLDEGHLNYYFFLLAGLMVLNQLLFYYVSAGYRYITAQELKEIEDKAKQEASDEEEDSLMDKNSLASAVNPLTVSTRSASDCVDAHRESPNNQEYDEGEHGSMISRSSTWDKNIGKSASDRQSNFSTDNMHYPSVIASPITASIAATVSVSEQGRSQSIDVKSEPESSDTDQKSVDTIDIY